MKIESSALMEGPWKHIPDMLSYQSLLRTCDILLGHDVDGSQPGTPASTQTNCVLISKPFFRKSCQKRKNCLSPDENEVFRVPECRKKIIGGFCQILASGRSSIIPCFYGSSGQSWERNIKRELLSSSRTQLLSSFDQRTE